LKKGLKAGKKAVGAHSGIFGVRTAKGAADKEKRKDLGKKKKLSHSSCESLQNFFCV